MTGVKAIILSLFAGLAVFAVIQYSPQFLRGSASLTEHADNILAECSAKQLRDRCYDTEIPKLMDALSMEDAFAVTKIIQNKDDSYWFCHTLGHELSTREYYKDKSQWKEVVNRCPLGMCSNGCIHGTIQEHFSSSGINEEQVQELLPDLVRLCEKRKGWNPTEQQTASCYHEIGHLSMYLTGANVNSAAGICDAVGVKEDGRNYLETCYEGIFMQVFQPREPEDFPLIYNIVPQKTVLAQCEHYTNGIEKGICWEQGWRGNLTSFCGQFPQAMQWACFREAWIVGNKEKEIETADDIVDYCSYSANPNEQQRCYTKLFFSIAVRFEFQENSMKTLCANMPEALRGQCFASMASRMVETDKHLISRAVGLCEYAKNFGLENQCYDQLLYYASFSLHPDSEEFIAYCSELADPWNKKCQGEM